MALPAAMTPSAKDVEFFVACLGCCSVYILSGLVVLSFAVHPRLRNWARERKRGRQRPS